MRSVLVVDDEKSIRITLREFLTNDGYDVSIAEDANDAELQLKEKNFDVVVTDIILPKVTGVELLKKIRNVSPHSQVIMMTGEPTVETASESLRSGAYDYLYKPISKDAILKSVRNAMFVKELSDEKRHLLEINRKYTEELEQLVEIRTKSLRESEEKYRSMMEAMVDPAYICSAQNKIEYMNKAMQKRIGYDATGKYCYEALHNKNHLCPWCSEDNDANDTSDIEFTSISDNKTFHISDSPIHHIDGTSSRLMIYRDITELKKMEKLLQQSYKMEAIGTLAGGIAHDFNNILTAMIGYSELIADSSEKGSDIYNNVQEILVGGMRAGELVQQILTFSRHEEQKKQPIEVGSILNETLQLIKASLPTTLTIKTNIIDNAIINGDKVQVQQVFMNLCTNAAHAMKDSEGILSVNLTQEPPNPALLSDYPEVQNNGLIKITVEDTGDGMTTDVLDRVFEPFYTTKEQGEGTGLGLSVVHGIVKNHSGVITVNSKVGKGTVFEVYFPAINKLCESEKTSKSSVAGGNEHILFVDDEQSIVKMEKMILKSLGYQVTALTSSIEAYELFTKDPEKFDLIITDMTMPGMNGLSFASKCQTIREDIPIILCTGFNENKELELGNHTGIKAIVSKPILKSELGKIIREVLE